MFQIGDIVTYNLEGQAVGKIIAYIDDWGPSRLYAVALSDNTKGFGWGLTIKGHRFDWCWNFLPEYLTLVQTPKGNPIVQRCKDGK